MTLLMLTLSPYYGPEVRVNFPITEIFRFLQNHSLSLLLK